MVELNGYRYEILESFDSEGSPLPITEEDELQAAIDFENFFADVKEWNDNDIEHVANLIKTEGITDEISTTVYEMHYDLCYFGNMDSNELITRLGITKRDLGRILA